MPGAGPRGWWLLGSIPEVLKVGIVQLNVDLAAKYGPIFKVGYAKYVVVAVADAHMARWFPFPIPLSCPSLRLPFQARI